MSKKTRQATRDELLAEIGRLRGRIRELERALSAAIDRLKELGADV